MVTLHTYPPITLTYLYFAHLQIYVFKLLYYSEMYVFRYEYIKCYFKKSVIILKLIFQTIYFQWRSTLVKIFLENINRNVELFFLVYILFFQTARKKVFLSRRMDKPKIQLMVGSITIYSNSPETNNSKEVASRCIVFF